MFQKKVVEKKHILCPITFFFSKIVPFMRQCKKICRCGRATDDNMAHCLACWIPKATNKH